MTVDERAKKAFDAFMKVHYMDLSDEMVMTAITHALRDQIEECAKLTDDESIRLDAVSMEYKQKGDLDTATRFSACIVTAAKLGRDIRALAGKKEETEDDGPDDRFDLGGFECNEKQED